MVLGKVLRSLLDDPIHRTGFKGFSSISMIPLYVYKYVLSAKRHSHSSRGRERPVVGPRVPYASVDFRLESSQPHPSEKPRAAQTSCIRSALKPATRRPSRAWATVTALCKLTAQRPFIPSAISRITSEGTPRMVDVIGATVTVARWPIALSRVRTTTGRCLSGGLNRQRRTSPLLSVRAMTRHPPKCGTLPPAAAWRGTRDDPALPTPDHASA